MDLIFRVSGRADIPCLGESSHIQVIVDHHQLVFQVGAGETVGFQPKDGLHVGGRPEQFLQEQPDAGLALAALAGQDQHLLRLGGRDEKVTDIFLQGLNVLWNQQLVQKFQPLHGRCGIRLVFDREPVQAEFLVRNKTTLLQIIGAVLEVDTIELRFPFLAVCLDLEGLYQTLDLFGNVIAGMVAYLLVNLVDELILVHFAVQVK